MLITIWSFIPPPSLFIPFLFASVVAVVVVIDFNGWFLAFVFVVFVFDFVGKKGLIFGLFSLLHIYVFNI